MAPEDFADEEWVDEEEASGDDLLTCPSCRQAVHEDTQQCPHFGDWIIPSDASAPWKRFVWLAIVILLILSFMLFADS